MLSNDLMLIARWLRNKRRAGVAQPITAAEVDRIIANLGAIAAGVAVLEQQTVAPQLRVDLAALDPAGNVVPLHAPAPSSGSTRGPAGRPGPITGGAA
jgi:hypothetical protein